jgi:uncharacterized protein YndB with AHSA1/START domain
MTAAKTTSIKVTLPSEKEIVLTREFDAPRSLVFEAFVKPEHLRLWWGRRGDTLSVCEVDLRVGGAWRSVIRKANGKEEPFKGEYREIVPPERLVYTFIYDVDGYRDPGGLVEDVFHEKAGKTTLVETMYFPSQHARDETLKFGMVEGAEETLDRLAELLATWVKGK